MIERKQVDMFNSLSDRYEPHEETANSEEKEFAITVIILQVFILRIDFKSIKVSAGRFKQDLNALPFQMQSRVSESVSLSEPLRFS